MKDFISKAKEKHGEKYDYSKVEYINSRTKVCIICPKHGEFWQTPANHLSGCGCPICKKEKIGEGKRLTKEGFIDRARKVHGNKYEYSKVEYKNSSTKICIICPEHGEFWQLPNNHLKGNGCPKCVNLNVSNTNEFIERARQVHGDKYDYSKVEYVNAKTKVCIVCKEHGEFWQTPHSHLNGSGCPKCGQTTSHSGTRKKTDRFILDSKLKHGEKYDYSKVEYVNNKTKVCIICPKHGEFWQTPCHHLQGHGCPKCKIENTKKNRTLSQEEFIAKCKTVYGDTYDFSKAEYVNTYTPVTIICKKHGEFQVKPIRLFQGQGCPMCSKEHYHSLTAYTSDGFIEKSKTVHGNKYDYSKVEYVNNKTNVCIICPKHGEFWQSPDKHLIGQGCPKCGNSISKNEEKISKFLRETLKLEVEERNKTLIPPYELDIYLPKMKLAIEYNGLIWHSEKFGKDRYYHLMKKNLCEGMGIGLIHIFEDEWTEHEEIVKSKLSRILKCDWNLDKVFARKCTVSEIDFSQARPFLNANHIQGVCNSTVYLGCFHEGELVGVMSFKRENGNSDKWELTRFATDIAKRCIGVGGKMFNYFTENYNPSEVKSFADRRWTVNKEDNLYTKIGFTLADTLKPDYSYTNGHNGREHKFKFRKQILLKKYGDCSIDDEMTEYEMIQKLGFHRIWNCGLYKYVWYKKREDF